jgi:hypothetical protein
MMRPRLELADRLAATFGDELAQIEEERHAIVERTVARQTGASASIFVGEVRLVRYL